MLLSDEQREFRDVIRRFAADKIAPLAAEADLDSGVLMGGL
jgi:alkylation response protein AidB-like acyl-CoA dehydrogenase